MTASTLPSNVSEDLRLLEYLSTDFLYLRRFVLASKHMIRLVQTEYAHTNPDMQEKLVNTIELAKDTLTEAGVSARPFVPCREELVQFKEAYYDMLVAAQPLVRHVCDSQTRLRLRRLLLPLSSTSCFRVNLALDESNDTNSSNSSEIECEPQPPTWWSDVGGLRTSAPSSPYASGSNSVLVLPGTPTRKVRVKVPKARVEPAPPDPSDWVIVTDVPVVPSSPQPSRSALGKQTYTALTQTHRKRHSSSRRNALRGLAHGKLSNGFAKFYAKGKAVARGTSGSTNETANGASQEEGTSGGNDVIGVADPWIFEPSRSTYATFDACVGSLLSTPDPNSSTSTSTSTTFVTTGATPFKKGGTRMDWTAWGERRSQSHNQQAAAAPSVIDIEASAIAALAASGGGGSGNGVACVPGIPPACVSATEKSGKTSSDMQDSTCVVM